MASKLAELESMLEKERKRIHRRKSGSAVKSKPAKPVTAQQLGRRRILARSLSTKTGYSVPGAENIDVIAQPSSKACWATVFTLMYGWKTQTCLTIETALGNVGPKWVTLFKNNSGLTADDKKDFVAAAGLVAEPPMSLTVIGWEKLLRDYGPIWVTTDEAPGKPWAIHARIIVAIRGDGTPAGTKFKIIDPAGGKEYTETIETFLPKYEEEVRETGYTRIQILHWPKDARYGAAKSASMAASAYLRMPLAMEVPSNPGNYRLLTSGTWNSNTTLTVQGGQGMWFKIRNVNVLGTTIRISDNLGQSSASVIPPQTTANLLFTCFGNEPMSWRFDIRSESDAFMVTWELWSTWVPGMPHNPKGTFQSSPPGLKGVDQGSPPTSKDADQSAPAGPKAVDQQGPPGVKGSTSQSYSQFFGMPLAMEVPSNPGNYRLLTSGAWNGNTSLSVQGGQGMWFKVRNTNVLGTTIRISDNLGQSKASVILPQTTVNFLFTCFGNEPMSWRFDIRSESDAFMVTWELWSTWVPGMPHNPKGVLQDKDQAGTISGKVQTHAIQYGDTSSDLKKQLEAQIAKGKIKFDSGKETQLEKELLRENTGTKITEKLQALILELSKLVDSHIRISSLIRTEGHHGAGRAVDIGNEEIAASLLPKVATDIQVAEMEIDELIFDAGIAGQTDRNVWNYDRGAKHKYSESDLNTHRDHIHFSVKN